MHIEISRIIRSRRRTVSLEVCRDSSLIVRAPLLASQEYLKKIVQSRLDWIIRKQVAAKAKSSEVRPKQFIDGEKFSYLGNSYELRIKDNLSYPFCFDNAFLLSRRYQDRAKDEFVIWYKQQARLNLSQRLKYYSQIAGLTIEKVNIKDADSRWGSCSSRGSLNFNWRLIMAPQAIIDYVVVHELAHIEVMDHSKKFWSKVASLFPDYIDCRKWLKANGHTMNI